MKRGRLRALLCVALNISAIAVAYAETITIGVTGDWSRATSYYSLFQRDVINTYFDILNKKGGISGSQIKLLWEDDENSPAVAVTKAEKLLANGACVVFSIGGSGTGIAVQAKLEELKVPHGSAANSLDALTNPVRKYYFRTAPKGSMEADAVIKYLNARMGAPKVTIVNDNTRTSLLISDEWQKALGAAGLETIGRIQFESGAADLSAQVLRIKELKPDVVLLSGSVPDSANFMKSYRRLGLTIPVQATYGMTAGSFADLVGKAGDGLVIIDAIDPDRSEAKAIFEALHPAMGDRVRGQGLAVMAWELSRLFSEAIGKAGGKCDREAIRDALEATRGWPTALGPAGTMVNFSPTNHDVFVDGNQAVMRLFEDGRLGRAVKWGVERSRAMESALAVLIAGAQIGSIYALVALSYVVLINATGILNFGQAEWLMVTAMLGLYLLSHGAPHIAAVPLSIGAAVALFLLCERFIIRPLQERGTSLMIVITSLLGIMIIIRYGTGLLAGPLALPLEPPFGMDAIWLSENVYVLTHTLFVYGATLAVFTCLHCLYQFTWLGRSLTLSAIDPLGAQLIGIDPSRVRFIAFALAGFITALVGWLYAPLYAAAFNIGEAPGLKGFIAAAVGGLSSPWGALLGGLVLGVIETGVSRYLPSAFGEASGFLLLMAILFLRPSGLIKPRVPL